MAVETLARVEISPPDPAFTGDLTAVFAMLQTCLRVKNPVGWNSFSVGTVAPSTNQGPWLKDGRQWYVWDTGTSAYVPQVLTDTLASAIPTVTSLPSGSTDSGMVFLSIANVGIGLYRWNGSQWAYVAGSFAGATASRPSSPPNYTKYFDTTIGCEIYFKPGVGWVTTAGVKGDIKFFEATTEADALLRNPGWEVYAPLKGRSPAGFNGAVNGFTDRLVGATAGAESVTLTNANVPPHRHNFSIGHGQSFTGAWGNPNDSLQPSFGTGNYGGPNPVNGAWKVDKFVSDTGAQLVTGGDANGAVGAALTGAVQTADQLLGQAHDNLSPTLYLMPMRKVQ